MSAPATEPTANLPAVRQQAEVMRVDTDSWINVMRPILNLAQEVYDTDFVPRGLRGNPGATAGAMLYGREVGLPPMTSLNMMHVVEGKPGLSAEGMRALVYSAGHELEFTETTGATCTMRGRRRGAGNWTTLSWTIDAARTANLTGKANWKSYPRAMLQARCTTEICRMIFPDVIHGFRSIEELEDMSDGDHAESAESGSTTAVQRAAPRKRAAAKRAAAQPRAIEAADMPPLPGEPGFDGDQEQASAAPDDAATASHAEDDGNDSEGAADAATVGPSTDSRPEPETPEQGQPRPSAPSRPQPETPEQDRPGPETAEVEIGGAAKASGAQRNMLFGVLGKIGVDDDRDERLLIVSKVVGREVESFNDLTKGEASKAIDTLAAVKDKADLNALLDAIDAQDAQS